MTKSIVIKNGKRLLEDGSWADFSTLSIEEGKIAGIDSTEASSESKVIDASGCLLFPGLIDLSVALREPGFHMKGSIASETAAAAAGGVTTVCCSPDTQPVNDSKAVTKLIEEVAEENGRCKVLPVGALTKGLEGELLSQYASLKAAGCVAVSNGFNSIKNLEITKRCFEYAKSQGLSVFINPIEPSLHHGAMHEGVASTTIGLRGIPSIAETIPVAQLIQIADLTGVHMHLSQLSAAESVELVKQAKSKGMNITADVAVQNLLFTETQVVDFDSLFHSQPPLRSEADRKALIAGVLEGTIDAIVSNHQPHEAAAKAMPFAEAEPGMSSIELLLPIAIKLDQADELPLATFVQAMTKGPAKVLGLDMPQIAADADADLCVFNPEVTWRVTASDLMSLGKNTPLLDQEIQGQVVATICQGRLTYQQ